MYKIDLIGTYRDNGNVTDCGYIIDWYGCDTLEGGYEEYADLYSSDDGYNADDYLCNHNSALTLIGKDFYTGDYVLCNKHNVLIFLSKREFDNYTHPVE